MILFANIRVTNKTLDTFYERGLYDRLDRYLVCCYALSSLSVIPWSAVRLYLEFDETQIQYRDHVLSHAKRLFPDAVIRPYQLANQSMWQEAVRELDEIDDELVWFLCNDDQIFVDYSLETVLNLERLLLQLKNDNPYVSGALASWSEYIAISMKDPSLRMKDGFLLIDGESIDSAQLVTKAIMRAWWLDTDYGDAELRRTDWGRNVAITYSGVLVIPRREILCHYDGSHHDAIDHAVLPPLGIPQGFFEGRMRVQYGGMAAPGITLVDPLNQHNSSELASGADWQSTVDQIPLFWRPAIAETTVGRQPTAKDVAASRACYLRRAAAAVKGEQSVILTHELMKGVHDGKELTTQPELLKSQGINNRSWANHLRNNGLYVFKTGDRRRPVALSVVIEDVDLQLAEQMTPLDLNAMKALGVQLVWIGLGADALCAPHGRYWAYAQRVMRSADRVAQLFPSQSTEIRSAMDSSMSMATGEIVLWLNTSKGNTDRLLLMLNDPAFLESVTRRLSFANSEAVFLLESGPGKAASVEDLIGVATLRGTALRLQQRQAPGSSPNRLTLNFLASLSDLSAGYLGINLTGAPAAPAQLVDIPVAHTKFLDMHRVKQMTTTTSFSESIFEFDRREEYGKLFEYVQQSPINARDLYQTMFQLLTRTRIQSAFILALVLEHLGFQDFLVSFALGAGGLAMGDSQAEARGLELMWAQGASASIIKEKKGYEYVIVPVVQHLLVSALGNSNHDQARRAFDLLKAAAPQFRTVSDLDLVVSNGAVYQRLF